MSRWENAIREGHAITGEEKKMREILPHEDVAVLPLWEKLCCGGNVVFL
jgi:hypothetical protein